VLDLADRHRADRSIDPLAVLQHLAEDADAHAIAAQFTAQDVGGGLEALATGGRRGVPVGYNPATERIGRCQRHESPRVETAAPEIGVDPERAATGVAAAAATATAPGLRGTEHQSFAAQDAAVVLQPARAVDAAVVWFRGLWLRA